MKMNESMKLPRALVVDDDVMMRLLIRRALEREGFEIEEADDGLKALETFARTGADIVLLDVLMPNLDGYGTCERLRQRPNGAQVPVLMLTGLDDLESINRAYEVGATDFISKPINWGVLGHRLRYMLRSAEALADLVKSRESLANAQRIAQLGSWEWNVSNGEVFWSEESYRVLGYAVGEVAPSIDAFLERVHPDEREAANEALERLLSECTEADISQRVMSPAGGERYVHVHGVATPGADGKAIHVSATIQDITERKRAELQIRYLAYYDSLTTLPNRQFFMERLAQALQQAKRHSRLLGVLSIDVDQFKRINDTLGHSVGDQLLIAIAERVNECVRDHDTVSRIGVEPFETLARLGGDEFSILLAEIARFQDAAKVAHRILEVFSSPFKLGIQEVFVTCSIGLSVFPADGEDAEALLKNADTAMHFAKEQGRNNYQFYGKEMNATALQRLSLEAQLRRGIERGEMVLYYQPKVDTQTCKIVGAEALIRWRHPEMGLVPPVQFIPLAEETGLVVPMGEWVLRTACAQAQAWQDAGYGALHIAVNIAGLHFRQSSLMRSISEALQNSGLDAARLEIEVTESMIMHDIDATLATLQHLKDMGLQLAIDDFGTGYSSLSYLKRFPIDVLKIDRSFIRDLPGDSEDAAITRAIIAMAHSLKLKVVAEGVEKEDQLVFLRQLRCDMTQGYLISPPVPAQDFLAILDRAKPAAKLQPLRLKA